MRQRVSLWVGGTTALLVPLLSFAQTGPQANFGPIGTTVSSVISFINSALIPLVFAIALLMFFWGMLRYIFFAGASEEGRDSAKQLMLWSVIAFVIMVSIWGIVYVVASGLGFSGANPPQLPTVPGAGGSTSGSAGSAPNSAFEGQYTQGVP